MSVPAPQGNHPALRVALVCSFGMSTSLLQESMERAARAHSLDMVVEAVGTAEVRQHPESYDAILLGPQVRYARQSLARLGKPLAVIDPFVYATANGEEALRMLLALMPAPVSAPSEHGNAPGGRPSSTPSSRGGGQRGSPRATE